MTLEEAQAIVDYMMIPNDQKDCTFFSDMSDDEFVGWMLAERTSLELISGWCYAVIRSHSDWRFSSVVGRMQGSISARIVKDVMTVRRLIPSW